MIQKFLPKKTRHKIYKSMISTILDHKAKAFKNVPYIELEDKHCRNTKCVKDRASMLKMIPENAIMAELGVDQGSFSQQILDIAKPQKLHLVDVWASERYNQNKREEVFKKFEQQLASGIVEMNLGYSTEVVSSFSDNYFDWIYIDTDHSYENTLNELKAYAPKMKSGGIMAGHDFIHTSKRSMTRFGVVEAVYQFCVENDWELVYLSMENHENPSYAIRKIA